MANTRRRKAGGTRKRGRKLRIGGVVSSKPVSKAVKQYVSKAISKSSETKILVQSGNTFGTVSTVINPINIRNLVPQIFQGNNVGQRVGNKITLRKVMLRGYITLHSNSTSPYPPSYASQFNVRLMLGHTKGTPILPPLSGDLSNLLRSGTGATDFSTDLMSLMRPVHRDYWVIKRDRKYKIGVASGTNLGVVAGEQNNDFSLVKYFNFNITNCYKKVICYDDAADQPQNCGLFMMLGCTDLVGSPLIPASPVIQLSYETEFYYDDN